jgi:protein TonB
MNHPVRNNGLTKLFAFSLLAVAASVPASGVSAAEPSVKATCSAPDHIASLKAASDPDYPAIAKAEGIHGSTLVRVSLNSTGAVKKATVAQSSGFTVLDNQALESARTSVYDPETVSCRPVAGTYFVNVTFDE